MDRIRTGVFYYCPVCGQPSGSTIPQSECLTCAANRFVDFATSPPPILRSPTSTATTLSTLLSDDEDELSSSLLWQIHEHNYGALDLNTRWCDEETGRTSPTTSVEAVDSTDTDEELVAYPKILTVVWLAVLMGLLVVIGAGVLFLVLV